MVVRSLEDGLSSTLGTSTTVCVWCVICGGGRGTVRDASATAQMVEVRRGAAPLSNDSSCVDENVVLVPEAALGSTGAA